MIVFEYTYSLEPNMRIRHEIDEDSDVHQACEAFEQFLRGAGYSINGHIVYEEEPHATD